MSNQQFDEYERDEEMLEARRLKRLEMKRKRKIQQRVILAVLAVVLIVIIVLIVKGCGGKEKEQEDQTPPVDNEEENQEEVQTPPVEPDTTATLAAVGDIMVYDDQIEDAKQEDLTYDFSDCFAAIAAYTSSTDLTVGNLELNFNGPPYLGSAKTSFNAPESLASNLKDIGFDILQTANTYSIMNGFNGLTSTINYLNDAGIDHVGTYATDPSESADQGVLIREVNGIRMAFIAFTKGVNGMSLPTGKEFCVDLLYTDYTGNFSDVNTTKILDRINAAKDQNPDVIIAMLHWGGEYDIEPTESQNTITDLLFKNGVDVIIGSHSHVVGPMEMKTVQTVDGETKDCFVAYSLGNFFSSMQGIDRDYLYESVILNLEFTKSGETGETTISNVSYTPLYFVDHGETADVRFEVVPIRKAIASSVFEDYTDVMTEAIAHLQTHTKASDDTTISYDSGN